ncbi:hypothetical protein BH09BAC5_BH09BAC5_21860 [soil metagenome]
MKILFTFIGLLAQMPFLFAQTESGVSDSTKVLFKNVHYSYMQYDAGYSYIPVRNQNLNGYDISLLGAVYNNKWFVSVGFNGWVSPQTQQQYFGTLPEPPKVTSYMTVYLNNEYVIQPEKLINFSIPLKIGYTGVSGYDTIPTSQLYISNWNFTGRNYYQYNAQFLTISPGANVFINLFKPLSLGVGTYYRFAFGVPKVAGNNSEYVNIGFNAFLRFKFDTKAYTKKMLERQKEYYKNMPQSEK